MTPFPPFPSSTPVLGGVQSRIMTDCQFFWYMLVNALVALGTIGAVIVALFHDYFKLAPQLCLRLLSDRGEKVRFGDGVEGRFYHLRVQNNRRWSMATSTGLHLVRLERRGPGEEWGTWGQTERYPGLLSPCCTWGHPKAKKIISTAFRLTPYSLMIEGKSSYSCRRRPL